MQVDTTSDPEALARACQETLPAGEMNHQMQIAESDYRVIYYCSLMNEVLSKVQLPDFTGFVTELVTVSWFEIISFICPDDLLVSLRAR